MAWAPMRCSYVGLLRCYCGVLGVWRPLPGPQADLWVLLAGHAAGCATAYAYGQGFFFRLFSPRFREPYTLLLSLFATSTPWECLWLYGMLFSTGPALQRILGRVGFAVLYLGGAACSTLLLSIATRRPGREGRSLSPRTTRCSRRTHGTRSLESRWAPGRRSPCRLASVRGPP